MLTLIHQSRQHIVDVKQQSHWFLFFLGAQPIYESRFQIAQWNPWLMKCRQLVQYCCTSWFSDLHHKVQSCLLQSWQLLHHSLHITCLQLVSVKTEFQRHWFSFSNLPLLSDHWVIHSFFALNLKDHFLLWTHNRNFQLHGTFALLFWSQLLRGALDSTLRFQKFH